MGIIFNGGYANNTKSKNVNTETIHRQSAAFNSAVQPEPVMEPAKRDDFIFETSLSKKRSDVRELNGYKDVSNAPGGFIFELPKAQKITNPTESVQQSFVVHEPVEEKGASVKQIKLPPQIEKSSDIPNPNIMKPSIRKFTERIKNRFAENKVFLRMSFNSHPTYKELDFERQFTCVVFYYILSVMGIVRNKNGNFTYPKTIDGWQSKFYYFFDRIYTDPQLSHIDEVKSLIDVYVTKYGADQYPFNITDDFTSLLNKIKAATSDDKNLLVSELMSVLNLWTNQDSIEQIEWPAELDTAEDEGVLCGNDEDVLEESDEEDSYDEVFDNCVSVEIMSTPEVDCDVVIIKSATELYQPIYAVWDEVIPVEVPDGDWSWLIHFMPVLKFKTSNIAKYEALNDEYSSIKFIMLSELEDGSGIIGLYNIDVNSFADETGEDEDIELINKIAALMQNVDCGDIFSHYRRTMQMNVYEDEDTVIALLEGNYTDASDDEFDTCDDEACAYEAEEEEPVDDDPEETDLQTDIIETLDRVKSAGSDSLMIAQHMNEAPDIVADTYISEPEIEEVDPDNVEAATILQPIRSDMR